MAEHIFIHGLGQTPSSWSKTISYMTEQERAVCIDLFSLLKGKVVTYENLYHAFSTYCENSSETLNLCGLSLGAVLALNYAIEYPAKVKSLVLIGAQYKMPKTLLKFQNLIFQFMPNTSFQKMGFEKKDFIGLTNSMQDLNFSEDLNKISCRTLIVCGEKDTANKKAAKILSESIAGSNICLVENAGHEVNVEMPEKLAEILKHFYI